MKLEQYLDEEWAASTKVSTKTYEIFSNPTKKEISDSFKEDNNIRFIIDGENKKLYVFNIGLLHALATKELQIPYTSDFGRRVFGIAFKGKEKLKVEDFDIHYFNNFLRKYKEESNWIWKYFEKTEDLKEEWSTAIKVKNSFNKSSKIFDVYRNPTKAEMNKAAKHKTLRFIATNDPKELYVWDSDMLHWAVARELGINIHGGDKIVLAGNLRKEANVWKFDDSFSYLNTTEEKRKKIRDADWKWTEKSFKGLTEYLKEDLKEEWETTIQLNKSEAEAIVYKNPSQTEMLKTEKNSFSGLKGIKWLADAETKTVWVFPNRLTHNQVAKEIGLENYASKSGDNPNLLGGFSDREITKWITKGIHKYDFAPKEKKKAMRQQDWSFLKKYNIYLPYKYLREEYADTIKTFTRAGGGKFETFDVFKNPDRKEMKEVSVANTIRYIAYYPTKTVYVFSPTILHQSVQKKLGIKTGDDYFNSSDLIGGVAVKNGNSWQTDEAHNLEMGGIKHKEEILKKDWKWVEKYIKVSDYLNEMRRRLGLNEEYRDTFKIFSRGDLRKKSVEIFVNPTAKEMKEVAEDLELRYIADFETKNVYVFNPDTLHQEIAQKLNLSGYWKNDNLLGGIAKLSEGKFKTIEIHNIDSGFIPSDIKLKIVSKDWSFVDKYIQTSNHVINVRKKLLRQKVKQKVREEYEL